MFAGILFFIFIPFDAFSSDHSFRTVQIINHLDGGSEQTTGTGFFIGPDILMTAFHVVDEFEGNVEDRLFFLDPRSTHLVPVTAFVGLSEKYDLAVLKVEGYEAESFYSVSDLPESSSKERVFLLGFADVLTLVTVEGQIREEPFYKEGSFSLMRTQSYNNKDLPGLSGGPVLSETGEIAGVAIHNFYMDFLFVNTGRIRRFLSQPSMFCVSHHCIHEERSKLRRMAGAGDGIARLLMGTKTAKAGNYNEALGWYEGAVEKEIPLSYYYMGMTYLQHFEDGEMAVFWFEEASKRGVFLADYALGLMHYGGGLIRRDFKRAAHWFYRASEQQYPLADYALGLMLYHGRGSPKNEERAGEWFKRAARRGYPPARKKLEELNIIDY